MLDLVAPGDDGIIETPSEDEEGGEDLMVEIWMSAEEDEMEERGMVDRSSRNDLADDDEDMADEGDIYE